jgi:hypothetical protein
MRNLRGMAIISLILFSIFVAATNGLAAHAKWNEDSQTIDPISKWEKRVKPVLDHIPSTVTELGYLADWDIPDSGYDLIDQDNEYTLTQYSLAPRIVQPGLDHEWIIGNFTNTKFRDWLDQNLSSYKLTEIGFGIYVIHRTLP